MNRNRRILAATIVGICIFISGCGPAATPTPTATPEPTLIPTSTPTPSPTADPNSATIEGTVFLSKELDLPAAGTKISLTEREDIKSIVSEVEVDSEGSYLLSDIQAGTYTLVHVWDVTIIPQGYSSCEMVGLSNGLAFRGDWFIQALAREDDPSRAIAIIGSQIAEVVVTEDDRVLRYDLDLEVRCES